MAIDDAKQEPEPNGSAALAPPKPKSFVEQRRELEEQLRVRDLEAERARKEARAKEYVEKVAPLLFANPSLIVCEGDIRDPSLGGWAVFREPDSDQCSRWKSVMWADYRVRGADERRKEAAAVIARNCLYYPDVNAFAKMVEKHPLFADECGTAVTKRAQAIIEAEEK